MEKNINLSVWLNCDPKKAFEMFTTNQHLEAWLTQRAEILPKLGGKFELFWDIEDEKKDNTMGCKITAFNPGKILGFEWKGPEQFKHFMNKTSPLTHVAVYFLPVKDDDLKRTLTEVHLIHTGWGESEEWETARAWFENAWADSFEKLAELVNENGD